MVQKAKEAVSQGFRQPGTPGGREGRRLARYMRDEREHDGVSPSNAEQVLATAVVNTAVGHVGRAARTLRSAQDDLVARAADSAAAVVTRTEFDAGPRRQERAARERAKLARDERALKGGVDEAAPLISLDTLLRIEVGVLVLEAAFWYMTNAAEIEPTAAWNDPARVAAYLFSIFIPLAALLAGRFAGPAWQRLLRHPAGSQHLRTNQVVHAVLGVVLVAVVAWATGGLVHWRYGDGAHLGAIEVPASFMTALFVAVVVLDAFLRGFCDSEQHRKSLARDREVAADRAQSDRLDAACITADRAWVQSWMVLEQAVARVLDDVTRVVCVGEDILLRSRSLRRDAPITTGRATAPVAGGAARLGWHVDVALLDTDLRIVEAALHALTTYAPPAVTTVAQLPAVVARLQLLDREVGDLADPVEPDPRPADEPSWDRRQDAAEADVLSLPTREQDGERTGTE